MHTRTCWSETVTAIHCTKWVGFFFRKSLVKVLNLLLWKTFCLIFENPSMSLSIFSVDFFLLFFEQSTAQCISNIINVLFFGIHWIHANSFLRFLDKKLCVFSFGFALTIKIHYWSRVHKNTRCLKPTVWKVLIENYVDFNHRLYFCWVSRFHSLSVDRICCVLCL